MPVPVKPFQRGAHPSMNRLQRVSEASRKLSPGTAGDQNLLDMGLGPGLYNPLPNWGEVLSVNNGTPDANGLYDMTVLRPNGNLGYIAYEKVWAENLDASNPVLIVGERVSGVFLYLFDNGGDIRPLYRIGEGEGVLTPVVTQVCVEPLIGQSEQEGSLLIDGTTNSPATAVPLVQLVFTSDRDQTIGIFGFAGYLAQLGGYSGDTYQLGLIIDGVLESTSFTLNILSALDQGVISGNWTAFFPAGSHTLTLVIWQSSGTVNSYILARFPSAQISVGGPGNITVQRQMARLVDVGPPVCEIDPRDCCPSTASPSHSSLHPPHGSPNDTGPIDPGACCDNFGGSGCPDVLNFIIHAPGQPFDGLSGQMPLVDNTGGCIWSVAIDAALFQSSFCLVPEGSEATLSWTCPFNNLQMRLDGLNSDGGDACIVISSEGATVRCDPYYVLATPGSGDVTNGITSVELWQ